MSSAARVEANRQNAQHSTGPRTAAGSQVSSLNAVRHGLTGQTMLLPPEEADAYRHYTEGFLKDLAPVGVHETQLAYSVMNGKWRLNQITVMETAIYALGYREHAPQFANETPEMAAALARALTFDQKRQDLDRLRRYENAINRQVNKDAQILADLQNARKAAAAQQEKDAVALLTHFTTTGKSWNPADFGFVLSIEEIQRLEQRQFILNRAKAAQSM
jgi:hypothetical protein